MICDKPFVSHAYGKECPESDDCIGWNHWCKTKIIKS
jgi:hypothetical protein